MNKNDGDKMRWPCWVAGLGLNIMSEDADDGSGWSEKKEYYISFDQKMQNWSLKIQSRTIETEDDGTEFEETSQEEIGPYQLENFKEALSAYEIKLSDELAQEIIKRSSQEDA